jgi:uncharacterized membrane protein YdbT with pleckstrin-like domain
LELEQTASLNTRSAGAAGMFSLEKHLDSNEQIVLAFRPARRAYIFSYIVYALLIFISLSYLGFVTVAGFLHPGSLLVLSNVALRYFAFFVIGYSLVMLIRVEWRIWSRQYAVTTDRVFYGRGIFSETFKSIQFAYITDIGFRQNLWDKIINTGSLVIDTPSNKADIVYRKVALPIKIKKMINDAQSKATGGLKTPAK